MLEPGELKIMRKKVGLTQKKLAELAGISQGMVARIESGTVDPKYSTLKKITDVLEGKKKGVLLAEKIMTRPVEYVLGKDKVKKAVQKMKRKDISQLPVLDKGMMAGMIREGTILRKYSELGSMKKLETRYAYEIMEAPLPTVSPKAGFEEIRLLLNTRQAVVVLEQGVITGIITKADVLKLS